MCSKYYYYKRIFNSAKRAEHNHQTKVTEADIKSNTAKSVLLAYDVHSSFHLLSVFVKCVDHHNRGLNFILLKPLTVARVHV